MAQAYPAKPRKLGFCALVTGVIVVSFGQAVPASDIDPDADRILQSMSDYMGNLTAFSVDADVDVEFVDEAGQKLQLTSWATLMLERPDNLYLRRRNTLFDVEIFFADETVTIQNGPANAYYQFSSPGNIDDALLNLGLETALDVSASDLLFSNPYEVLSNNVEQAVYYGTTYVNGVEAHYLAMREDDVDWQLWVQTGETPLPLKYVITTKWLTGAPQYSIRFRNWDTTPDITAGQFDFVPSDGATQLEEMPQVNGVGDLLPGGE
jgi:hypothetical protein